MIITVMKYANNMSKLPSERIKEIVKDNADNGLGSYMPDVIIQYLDEQYEQNKPCGEHNWRGIQDTLDLSVCKNCGKEK